jgi:hypothetical protein
MHIHLDAHMHFHKHIKPGPSVGAPSHDRPTQTAGPVRSPCARIRFWRAASRDRLRRRRTPARHHRGTPARTAWGGHVGDRGAPGADDGVAGESVQCRPGRSPGGAVDVCRVTPQASRRGGLAAIRAQIRTGQVLGKFPKVVTRLTGTLDRIAARRRAQPATDTFRKSAPPVSAGSMPTVTVSALPSGYNAAGSAATRAAASIVHRDGATSAAGRSPPGAAVTPLPPLPLGWLRPARRRSHPRPSPPVLAVTGRGCRSRRSRRPRRRRRCQRRRRCLPRLRQH